MPRRCVITLTALALLVTGFIPHGWMPTLGDDGRVLLVICTSDGVVEQWVDLSDDDPIHDEADDRAMCPFAGLLTAGAIPTVGLVLPFEGTIQPRWTFRDFTRRSAGFHTRYDARGPPVFS